MRFGSVVVFASLTTVCCLIAPACSDEPSRADDDDSVQPDATRAEDASRRDGATGRDAALDKPDARRDGSSEADAASEQDAGADGGSGPGSACTTPGTRYERACGSCGVQTAVCTGGVVGNYGACNERHPGFCQGDAGESDAGESDAGEPVDAWDGYSIDIDFAAGQTGSITMPAATGVRNRISVLARRTCPVPLPASPSPTQYALVRVRNTTAQSLTVDVNVTRGVGPTDVILAMYAAPPISDDELKSCFGSADGNTCPDPAGAAAARLSCLTGAAGVVLPAGSSSYAYVAMYSTAAAWNGPGLSFTRQP